MKKKRDPLACIIPHFKGEAFLANCLKSLLPQLRQEDIVFIINDQKEPLQLEEFLNNERIHLIQNPGNLGFGRSCNVGIYLAQQRGYHQFFVLNQDTRVGQDCVQILQNALSNNGEAIYFPIMYTYDFARVEDHFIKRYLKGKHEIILDKNPSHQIPLDLASGAAFILHWNVIEKLSGFDPLFRMYGEDDDLFARAGEMGIQRILCTGAKIAHYHTLIKHRKNDPQRKLRQFRGIWINDIRHERLNRLDFTWRAGKSILRHFQFTRPVIAWKKSVELFRIHGKWKKIKEKNLQKISGRILNEIKRDLHKIDPVSK